MEKWIEAVRRQFKEEALRSGNEGSGEPGFVIGGGSEGPSEKFLKNRNALALRWKYAEEEYVLGAGKTRTLGADAAEDRLEEILDDFLGDWDSELYAAREVVIDDMIGLEVCGGSDCGDKGVFYSLFLSDYEEGYKILGFGSGDPETVFNELSGAARTFYRLPAPATVKKGKTPGRFFEAARSVASKAAGGKKTGWSLINLTFEVMEGEASKTPSVIGIFGEKAEICPTDEIFPGTDFEREARELLKGSSSPKDTSGFTVTVFADGRYGLTYYPATKENSPVSENCSCENHEEHLGAGCSCHWKGREEDFLEQDEEADLEPVLTGFARELAKVFPENWRHGMGLVTAEDGYFALAAFSSCEGSFAPADIPETMNGLLSDKINDLGDLLVEGYPQWNAFAFAFEKTAEGRVNSFSLRYEIFDFDIFLDANDEETEEDEEYLFPMAEVFFEELNMGPECIGAITFKLAVAEDGVFVIEPAAASAPDGVAPIGSFELYLPKIVSIVEDVFEKYEEANTISVTLFPGSKLGVSLEYTETPAVANRRNLPELLKEAGLGKYEKRLEPLVRDEILGVVYEVEAEEALAPGISKIGGLPDLPPGISWSENREGRLMPFVAQVDMEEIAPFVKDSLLPSRGVLSFFYDDKNSQCAVLYNDSKALELTAPKGGVRKEYLPARLRFVPSVSLPIREEGRGTLDFIDPEDEVAYDDISSCPGKTKMFGYADFMEEDMEKDFRNPAYLLLQLPSLEECDMEWGDGGTLYFWIDEEDLKARRFHKCRCVIQSY